MNTNKYLLILRLEGPLQSWGIRARWVFRDTIDIPTKSGIIGLLGCALGYKKGDKRLESELNNNLKISIRVEKTGKIATDFHTVIGDSCRASGSISKSTIVSNREYLEDWHFLVVIDGPKELLEKCKNALEDPKWPYYLGRKCCIPTRPIFEDLTNEYSSVKEAMEKIKWSHPFDPYYSDPKKKPKTLRCIIEDPDGNILQQDSLKISPSRIYSFRRLKELYINLPS
ncbi:MAG: type I-E CRISPR-associated protein Cas5/CasD [Candidatus Helarchaeota archaeon]